MRLARSQLLEGAGGPYSGSLRSYVSSLTLATNHIIKRILGMFNVSLQIFVLELQWTLLAFLFWPQQKNASHAPTAHRLTVDTLHIIRVAAFLVRASPNRFLKAKTKRGGGRRREEERENTCSRLI